MRKRLALGLCIPIAPTAPSVTRMGVRGPALGRHAARLHCRAQHMGGSHQLHSHNVNAAPEVPSIQYSYPGAGSSPETFHWEVEKPGPGANRKSWKDGPLSDMCHDARDEEITHISTQLVD